MAFKQRSSGSFKMMGSSPAKAVETDNETKRANLLKAVPNEAAYNKLSDDNKKGFDAAGKKAGLPQKTSPAKAKTNPKISLGMGKEADANLGKKVSAKTTKGINNYTKTNAAGNRVDMMGNEHTAKARANRNAIGAPKKKGNVGYKAQAAAPKGFNTKGGKTTTPGYSTTKAATKATPKKGINLVKRTTDLIHKNEKKIGELKESRAKDIKKVKGNTVKISKKDVLKQMKKAGTKLPYSSVKNALKTSIKAAGKVAKFVPGVVGLVLGATKTATADQPTKGKGKREYEGGKIDFTKKK